MDEQQNTDQQLIERFGTFVEAIAARLQRELGLSYELQDLVAFGYAGLLEARTRFEPALGVPFKLFAARRIRGAIIDGIRNMSYLPRRIHARLKLAEALDAETEAATEHADSDPPSIATSQPRAVHAAHTLDQVLGRMAVAYTVATHGHGCEAAPDDDSPEELMLRKQRRSRLDRAITELPAREQLLIRGHYLEGRSLDEIARSLGLSRSWASRIHSRALSRLRHLLSGGP